MSYVYDDDNQLISAETSLIKYEYTYDDRGNILTKKEYSISLDENNEKVYTLIEANTDTYVYDVTNSRGDIEELRHLNGSLIARYTYDTGGNTLSIVDASGNEITSSTALPVQNPFRYRGYYYDSETSLYYLQSRYYDLEIGRWINSDNYEMLFVDYDVLLQYNLYAYCLNNPINNYDPDGYSALALAGGGYVASTYVATATAVGSANAWNPVGVIVLGSAVVVVAVVAYNSAKNSSGNKSDPYARPGQKKQGRERRSKARQSKDWKPKSTPKPPKKHTPGKGHRKYK